MPVIQPTNAASQVESPGYSGADAEKPILDGFVLSASQLYLPTGYRVHALAQMETLRRAKGYRPRWYTVPEDLEDPIAAFSQMEYQISTEPGSYVWGLAFTQSNGELSLHVQLVDACTETAFFSDYPQSTNLDSGIDFISTSAPVLISPRLIGQPGTINVEIYNRNPTPVTCQLVVFIAEPQVPNADMQYALKQAGVLA